MRRTPHTTCAGETPSSRAPLLPRASGPMAQYTGTTYLYTLYHHCYQCGRWLCHTSYPPIEVQGVQCRLGSRPRVNALLGYNSRPSLQCRGYKGYEWGCDRGYDSTQLMTGVYRGQLMTGVSPPLTHPFLIPIVWATCPPRVAHTIHTYTVTCTYPVRVYAPR